MQFTETVFERDGKTIYHFDFGGGCSQEAESPAVAEIIRRSNREEDERIQAESEALAAAESAKQHLAFMLRDPESDVKTTHMQEDLKIAEMSANDASRAIEKTAGAELPALRSATSCELLEAAHETANAAGAPKLMSSMYRSRGGKAMLEKLRDPDTRKSVMADIISRQLVDCELISQFCTTAINMIGMDKVPGSFDNDGTFFQNVLKTKLRVDSAQRAAILADSKLSGVQGPGLNVRNVNQLNVSHVQQVRNHDVVEDGENNITNVSESTLPKPKHKRKDLECTSRK